MLGCPGHERRIGALPRRCEMIKRVGLREVDRNTAPSFEERPKAVQSCRIALRGREPMLSQHRGGIGLARVGIAEHADSAKHRQCKK